MDKQEEEDPGSARSQKNNSVINTHRFDTQRQTIREAEAFRDTDANIFVETKLNLPAQADVNPATASTRYNNEQQHITPQSNQNFPLLVSNTLITDDNDSNVNLNQQHNSQNSNLIKLDHEQDTGIKVASEGPRTQINGEEVVPPQPVAVGHEEQKQAASAPRLDLSALIQSKIKQYVVRAQVQTSQLKMKRQIGSAIKKSGVKAFEDIGIYYPQKPINWDFNKIGSANAERQFSKEQMKEISKQFGKHKDKCSRKNQIESFIDHTVFPCEFSQPENVTQINGRCQELLDEALEASENKPEFDSIIFELQNLPQILDLQARNRGEIKPSTSKCSPDSKVIDIKEQMRKKFRAVHDGHQETQYLEVNDWNSKNRESYQHQVFQYDGSYFFVQQQQTFTSQEDSAVRTFAMSFRIYHYDPKATGDFQIIHEGFLFNQLQVQPAQNSTPATDTETGLFITPQHQAFMQCGQYLYFITVGPPKPKAEPLITKEQIILNKLNLQTFVASQLQTWPVEEVFADSAMTPFYFSFLTEYESEEHMVPPRSAGGGGTGLTESIYLRDQVDDTDKFMLDQFVLVSCVTHHRDPDASDLNKSTGADTQPAAPPQGVVTHQLRNLSQFSKHLASINGIDARKPVLGSYIQHQNIVTVYHFEKLSSSENAEGGFKKSSYDIDYGVDNLMKLELKDEEDAEDEGAEGDSNFETAVMRQLGNCALRFKSIKCCNSEAVCQNLFLSRGNPHVPKILELLTGVRESFSEDSQFLDAEGDPQIEFTCIFDEINQHILIFYRKLEQNGAMQDSTPEKRYTIIHTYLNKNTKQVGQTPQTFLNRAENSYFSREMPSIHTYFIQKRGCDSQCFEKHICLQLLEENSVKAESSGIYTGDHRHIELKSEHFLNKTIVRDGVIMQQNLIEGIRIYKVVSKSQPFRQDKMEIELDQFELVIESSDHMLPSKYDQRKAVEIIFIQQQLQEFDQKQIPVLAVEKQSIYLLIIDLVNLEIDQQIMLDINPNEFQQISSKTLVYSSEPYCQINEIKQQVFVYQNYHACFKFNSIQRVLMFEFRMEWRGSQIDKTYMNPQITIIGNKELILNCPQINMNASYIGCLCHENYFVVGVKFNVYDQADNLMFNIDMYNNQSAEAGDESQVLDNCLTQTSYQKLRLQNSQQTKFDMPPTLGILICSQTKEEVLQFKQYRQYEISQNLRNSIRTVLNMKQASLEEYILKQPSVDVFQNSESLLGLSLSDLIINNPQEFQNQLIEYSQVKTCCHESESFSIPVIRSLLEEVTDNRNSRKLRAFYQNNGLMRQFREHTFDLTYSFTLERCLSLMIKYIERDSKGSKAINELKMTAEIIIGFIQKEPATSAHYQIMMTMLPQFVSCHKSMVPKKYYEFLERFKKHDDPETQLYMYQLSCKSEEKQHLKNTKIGFAIWLNEESVTQIDIHNQVDDFIQQRANNQIDTINDYQHFYIDFRQISLHKKNQLMQDGYDVYRKADDDQKNFDRDGLVNLIHDIYSKIGKKISDYPILQKIIDQQFIHTEKIFFRKIVVYFVFYFIPLLYQFYLSDKISISVCLTFCTLVQLFLFYLETKQMRLEGWEYLFDIWNIIDIINFFINGTFVGYRFTKLDKVTKLIVGNIYAPGEFKIMNGFSSAEMMEVAKKQDYQIDPFLCILSISLVFFSFMKMMYFLKAQENFGKMSVIVQLVFYCAKDIVPVMIFMIGWITFFSFIQSFIAIQVDTYDYKGVSYSYINFVNTWRISIGDIIVPVYNYWINDLYQTQTQELMTVLALTFWFLNHLIILIILLNLLISILSDSFEYGQSQMIVNKYANRVKLNQEISAYNADDVTVDCIIVSVQNEDEIEEQWDGFVASIKKFLKKETKTLKDKYFKVMINKQSSQYQQMNELDKKIGVLSENHSENIHKIEMIQELLNEVGVQGAFKSDSVHQDVGIALKRGTLLAKQHKHE